MKKAIIEAGVSNLYRYLSTALLAVWSVWWGFHSRVLDAITSHKKKSKQDNPPLKFPSLSGSLRSVNKKLWALHLDWAWKDLKPPEQFWKRQVLEQFGYLAFAFQCCLKHIFNSEVLLIDPCNILRKLLPNTALRFEVMLRVWQGIPTKAAVAVTPRLRWKKWLSGSSLRVQDMRCLALWPVLWTSPRLLIVGEACQKHMMTVVEVWVQDWRYVWIHEMYGKHQQLHQQWWLQSSNLRSFPTCAVS